SSLIFRHCLFIRLGEARSSMVKGHQKLGAIHWWEGINLPKRISRGLDCIWVVAHFVHWTKYFMPFSSLFIFCQRKKYWKGMIGIFLITHGNATMAEAQIS